MFPRLIPAPPFREAPSWLGFAIPASTLPEGRSRNKALAALLLAFTAASTAGAQDLLIENVTLLDGTGAPAVDGAWIAVKDGRISAVDDAPLQAPEGAITVNGEGRYLMPGMVDMHIHLRGGVRTPPEGLQKPPEPDFEAGIQALHGYLYSGFTLLYDAGNDPDFILELRRRERAGEIEGPRIFATGGIVTYPGSHGSSAGATLVDDWPEAKPLLDAHIARDPDVLKLTYEERGWGSRPTIPRLPVDLMQAIVEYYNERGIRTTVHTSSELRARQAIFAGVDTLAHPIIQGPITEEFARLMAAKGTPMVTTLTIGENYARLVETPEYLDQPLYRATIDANEIEILKTETRAEYEARPWTWWMKVMTEVAKENVRMVHAAGGVLVAGSDQTSGPAGHRELELLQDAGIAPADIIPVATLNGAVFLGREKDLGSIEVGKLADMVLLSANPAEDINNAKAIVEVIKGGRLIDRSALSLPVNR